MPGKRTAKIMAAIAGLKTPAPSSKPGVPKQPSADLLHTSFPDQALKDLAEFNEKHGVPGRTPGSYEVQGFLGSTSDYRAPAQMMTVPRGQYHEQEVYGREMLDRIKDSLLSPNNRAGHPILNHAGKSGPADNVERVAGFSEPLSVFYGDGINGAYADMSRYVAMNHRDVKEKWGGVPSGAFRHEMGHVMNLQNPDNWETRWVRALSRNPSIGPSPYAEFFRNVDDDSLWSQDNLRKSRETADRIGTHINYTNRTGELLAEYSRLKGMNYGMTGQVPFTPKQHMEMIQKALVEPIAPPNLRQGEAPFGNFGPNPMFRHGPQQGRPAHGWNHLHYYLQEVLKDATPEELEKLYELGPHIVSNEGANNAASRA